VAVAAAETLCALATFGGGDVSVQAGRDILGGRLDVASGSAQLAARGQIGSSGDLRFYDGFVFTTRPNGLRVRLTDATVAITAQDVITLQGIAALGAKSNIALDRLYARAAKLNKLRRKDIEDLEKNLDGGPSGASG
jgi:hypothetical protein